MGARPGQGPDGCQAEMRGTPSARLDKGERGALLIGAVGTPTRDYARILFGPIWG